MGDSNPLRLAPTPNEVVTMHALVDRFLHTVTKGIPVVIIRDEMYKRHTKVFTVLQAAVGATTVFGVERRDNDGLRIIDPGALVFRKDGYAVRLVDGEMLQRLVAHEGLIVWELKADAVTGLTDASILNTLRTNIVELQCGVVVVRGLRRVSAVLFKWCAEFTKSNPWCYIFFDDLDTNLLLLEDLNRLLRPPMTTDEYCGNVKSFKRDLFGEDEPSVVNVGAISEVVPAAALCAGAGAAAGGGPAPPGTSAGASNDPVSDLWESPRRLVWKSDIAKCIYNDDYALITGPPGIGKTFLMEQEFLAKAQLGAAQLDKQGRVVLRLDGSNERFTLESMSDWLDRNIVGTDPVMLIVDEFHRLPRDMKDQLLRWCSPRRFIKLVMIANRYDFADQALFSQHLHRHGSVTQASVDDTLRHITECCGSTNDVMHIKVVGVLHEILVDDKSTLEAWKSSPFKCATLIHDKVPMCLFFARLWLLSTAFLFGDEVLSLRDVEKGCAVLSILPPDRDSTSTWPSTQEEQKLCDHLTAQLADLEMFAPSFVKAVCYVYKNALALTHGGPLAKWRTLWEGAGAGPRPLTVYEGILQFDSWVKEFLAGEVGTPCFKPPSVRQDGLDPCTLLLARASVLDPGSAAMPFPVFVTKGWLVESITSFSPFARLGLWVAYMENFSSRHSISANLSKGSQGDRQAKRAALAVSLVHRARAVASELQRHFAAVDNPTRFPSLRVPAAPVTPGTVTEVPVDLDPSQLLEVASALKHGQVIPWDLARQVWSAKPISNVGLFGLLVSTWPAFLDEFVNDANPVTKKRLLENVRKLIDAASDKSLAEACLAKLNLPLDDPVVSQAPHLSPAMAATWRVYRESSLEVLARLACTEPLFKSRVTLPQLLKWAAQNGTDSATVPGANQARSELLRDHLILATESALRLEVPQKAAASVEAMWSGWFAALVPDIDAARPLPMTAYAILAFSVKRPVVSWPRLLQAMCRLYNRVSEAAAPALAVGSDITETNFFLEAVPGLWRQLRGADGGWVHPMAEDLVCGALTCPALSPAAQVSLILASNTGGTLRVSPHKFSSRLRGLRLNHLVLGLRFLPHTLPTDACAFTQASASEVLAALAALPT